MNESSALLLIAAAALLFYAAIPGIGAFAVRARWRRFRQRLRESSILPFLRYADLSSLAAGQNRAGGDGGTQRVVGHYRVFGDLEAIQGSHQIWINAGQFTVCVDLEKVSVYLLPSTGPAETGREIGQEMLPDEQPSTVPWSQIFSLPAGTRMFVSGALIAQAGGAMFRSHPAQPLLVVIYDGDRASILQRAISGGRQRNEYWNQFTVPSLLTGSFCMLLLAFVLLRSPMTRLAPLAALSLAFFPLAGLLPPGFVLYYLYRHFWRTGRRLRAERDMLRLPLRYFGGMPESAGQHRVGPHAPALTTLPTGEPYLMSRDPDLLIRGELAIRGTGLTPGPEGPVLFGTPDWDPKDAPAPGAERWVRRPEDPMAELVLVAAEPAGLAEVCERRARRFEFLAAVFVFAALVLNHFLLLLLWNRLIR